MIKIITKKTSQFKMLCMVDIGYIPQLKHLAFYQLSVIVTS